MAGPGTGGAKGNLKPEKENIGWRGRAERQVGGYKRGKESMGMGGE